MDVLISLAGGVALLLWGIRMVRTGVTRAFGSAIHKALAASTGNRLTAFAMGLGVTGILQSSTATALIVSSFASRNLITISAALAVMLGADVGTTLVVQVLSYDINWLSPLLILGGVVLFLSTEVSRRRNAARIAIGLGLMLLAIRLIVLASHPLRDGEAVAVLMGPLTHEPLLALAAAAALTWLAHSSLTVVVLVMSLASLHVISIQLALALTLGANLGGAIAPIVMTLGSPAPARRVPLGNLLMRAAGALGCVWLIPWLAPYLSPLGDSPERMVANFHTGFNLALALIFLPLTGLVALAVEKLLPDGEEAEDEGRPRYLETSSLDTPAVALACAGREVLRMGDAVERMLVRSMEVFRKDDAKLMREIEVADDVVDRLHEAIKLYLTRLTKQELDSSESSRTIEILGFTTNLEHIGDIIDKNVMELAAKKIRTKAAFSAEGLKEIEAFHARVVANLRLSLNTFMSGDLPSARRLLEEKVTMRELERKFSASHYDRIGQGRPESLESSSLHLDLLRDLKRINSHLTSVAYPILESAGQLAPSRLVGADEAGEPGATGRPVARPS